MKIAPHRLIIKALLIVALVFPLCASEAVVLDWTTVWWPDGALSRNFNIDFSSPGQDVNVTISGSTGRFFDDYPQITEDFTGGFGSSTDQLDLFVNFGSLSEVITVTVTFDYDDGVDNVFFTLFDIDTASGSSYPRGFIDQVKNITGKAMDGTTVIPTITGSANNTVLYGGSLTQVVQGVSITSDTGSDSGNGNAYFDFGDHAIQSFTFTYGNSSTGVFSNPSQQGIGLYDISYTKAKPRVPEFHPAWAALMLCAATAIPSLLRSRFS